MQSYFLKKIGINTIILPIILCTNCLLFAQEQSLDKLSTLQQQARVYRNQGLESQSSGDLDTAMSLYQKAVELDPTYAVAYNDLGVVFEAKGFSDRAEQSYLKAIKIDSNYLSAYSNLALFYENKRDFEKAYIYWKKRAKLGSPDDPWTIRAKERIKDIRMVKEGADFELESREQEVTSLMKEVLNRKSLLKDTDEKTQVQKYFEKAKQSYDRGDYALSRKEALDALALDPANREIEEFIEKAQTKALSR